MIIVCYDVFLCAQLMEEFYLCGPFLSLLQFFMEDSANQQRLAIITHMFSENSKKRLRAIRMLPSIAQQLGPTLTCDELLPFLDQFINQTPQIMLAVVKEILFLGQYLTEVQHRKKLLKTLVKFCYADQIEVGTIITNSIKGILRKETELYSEVLDMFDGREMKVAIHCLSDLIISGISVLPHKEQNWTKKFQEILSSNKASIRLVAYKKMNILCQVITNKENIIKLLSIAYQDEENLPKLLTIDVLISLYRYNQSFVINKLKLLLSIDNWRFNMKICEYVENLSQELTSQDFKAVIKPGLLGMMKSEFAEVRQKSCEKLQYLAKNMQDNEDHQILLQTIQNLSKDKCIEVKAVCSKEMIKTFPFFSIDEQTEKLLPLVFLLIKSNNTIVLIGIIENLTLLRYHMKKIKNNLNLQEEILQSMKKELSINNWRQKMLLLTALGQIAQNDDKLAAKIVTLLIKECIDRVEKVRNKAAQIIIQFVKRNSEEWIQKYIIPKLNPIIKHRNYLVRQVIFVIINQTADQNIKLKAEYKSILSYLLRDKVPNIRMSALKTVMAHPSLRTSIIQSQVDKMKSDIDSEIRIASRTMNI